MAETHQKDLEPQRFDQFEDEIELMDYLKVIWKWKYLILIGTLVCAIGAAVVSLNMAKVYGITTVLQPGMLKVTEDGKTIYIDSPLNIKALIETNAVNGRLLKNIDAPNKDDVPQSVEFKVTIPKGTNALEVLYETPHVDIGLQIVKNLNKLLLERYGKVINSYYQDYDGRIRLQSNEIAKVSENISKVKNSIGLAEISKNAELERIASQIFNIKNEISEYQFKAEDRLKELDNEISNMKAEVEAKKNQIDTLKQGMPNIKLEIDRISKNTDLLIQQRNRLLSNTGPKDDVLSALVYSNTVQQNISYLNTLRGTMNDMINQRYSLKADLEKLENRIKDLGVQKESTRKQTGFRIDVLQTRIKDLEATKMNLEKETKINIDNLKSQINDLESDRKYKAEEIKSIEFSKNNIQNIQLIKAPQPSLSPLKPKTRLNVMLAGVVGLFLTVFLAFFVEYISKYKSREDER